MTRRLQRGRDVLVSWVDSPGGWSATLLALVCSLAAAAAAWLHLDSRTIYPEFVVGPQSYTDAAKVRDMMAFRVLLVFGPVLHLFVHGMINGLVSRSVLAVEQIKDGLFLLWAPLIPWLGMMIAAREGALPDAWILSVVIASLTGIVLVARRPGCRVGIESWPWIFGGAILFLVFSGFALGVAVSTLGPGVVMARPWLMHGLAMFPLAIGVPALIAGLMRGNAVSLRRGLIISQIPCGFLGLSLLPEPMVYRGVVMTTSAPVVWVAVAIFAVLLLRSLYSRMGQARTEAGLSAGELISPWSVAAIALFCAVGAPGYSTLPADDFHFGELVLPWHQWAHFGKVPFVDFFPFHGWMHLVTGFVNQMVFDGTVAQYENAVAVLFAVSAALTAVLVYRLAGPVPALLSALVYLPQSFYAGRLLFVAPVFLSLALPSLCRRPTAWLAAWAAGGVFLGLYNTVTGAGFVLATLSFALWQTWLGWRSERRSFVAYAGLGIVVIVLVVMLPATRAMLTGYLSFILENRPAYDIVQGRAWSDSFGVPGMSTGWLSDSVVYEAVRLMWIPVLLVLLYLAGRMVARSSSPAFGKVFLVGGAALWLISISAYALGRLDVGSPSRTGSVTYLMCTILMPVILWREGTGHRRALLAALLAVCGVLTAFLDAPGRLSWRGQFWNAHRLVHVPDGLVVFDGAASTTNGIGRVFVAAERSRELGRFREVLDQVLGEGRSYFDLSNRQALYVYSDRPVPFTHPACANIDNGIKQRRVLAQWMEQPPPAVLAFPRSDYDWDVNIRSYILYRHILLHYRPVMIDGYGFMVNSNSPMYASALDGEQAVRSLLRMFPLRDLGRLPSAWGRSWPALAGQAERISDLGSGTSAVSTGGVMRREWTLSSISGTSADLLVIERDIPEFPGAAIAEIDWVADDGAVGVVPVRLVAAGPRLVVPLGLFPDWLLAGNILTISLKCPSSVMPVSAALWQRRDLDPESIR